MASARGSAEGAGDGLWTLGLCEGSERVRSGDLSCATWVDAVLERARATEPQLRAFSELDREGAMREARRVDGELRRVRHAAEGALAERYPLAGAAVSIKDSLDCRGLWTTAGSAWYRRRAVRDAEVVQRLRSAGAVVIGKTVAHEFGFGVNRVTTLSPWGEQLYTGGSSAGSGVSVGVGSSVVSVGTDAGGSIRIPAALNGIVGLRPTPRRIPGGGHVPLSPSTGTVGPLARSVDDCQALHSVMAGRPHTAHLGRPGADAVRLARPRVGVIEELWVEDRPVDSRLREVCGSLLSGDPDLEVVGVSLPMLGQAKALQLTLMLAEAAAIHHSQAPSHWLEYSAPVRAMLEHGAMISAVDYLEAQVMRRRFGAAIRRAMARRNLQGLVHPTVPLEAAPLDRLGSTLSTRGSTMDAYVEDSFVASVAGLPALAVPVGLGDHRLPISLEVIGRPDGEPELFRIGRALAGRFSVGVAQRRWSDFSV